jgi:hypothetical protein
MAGGGFSVNMNQYSPASVQSVDIGKNGNSDVYYNPVNLGPVATRHVVHQKPNTTRNPKNRSGWRDPSSYYRFEVDETPWPNGNTTQIITSPPYYPYDYGTIYEYGPSGFAVGARSLPSFPSGLEDTAIIKALGKLKNQQVNLAVAFAERAETAELFSSVIGKIAKSVRQFRSKNPRTWGQVIASETGARGARGSKIPEGWLQLQYGWKPLQQDVYGACDALNHRERDADAYRASVKGAAYSKERATVILKDLGDYGSLPSHEVTEFLCAVHLDYTLENPVLATLSQLGITNPALLVWEKLPYSFVIDWASPIGAYLSAFDAALGWGFKGGSCSKVTKLVAKGEPVTGSNPAVRNIYSWDYHCNMMAFNRDVYTSSPLPRFPGIKNPLSTGHVANALSLLAQAFR